MRNIFATALFAAAALTAGAADIDSIAAAIASANPAVLARRAELRSASLSMSADGMLPGPEIEGEHLWGPAADNRWGVGISQSFDWPGVYAARRGARRASDNAFVQLAHAELAEQRLAAKLALIDLVAARREAAAVRGIYNNVQELLDLTRRALDHGQATILDVRKLQIEQLEVARRLEEAEQARAEAVAALRAMGCDADVPDALDYPAASVAYADAAARWMASPALMAARAEAEASDARA
ncbi:MAG: TolC family protein, partial [Muribaculaceae bacterium]|nr:TolC family protein [Muribaculaceae bacterium]